MIDNDPVLCIECAQRNQKEINYTNEIIKFVIDGVDIEDIKKSLSESIKRNYYSPSSSVEKNSTKWINKEKDINE